MQPLWAISAVITLTIGIGLGQAAHFSYGTRRQTGPKFWREGECGSPVRQSPINIVTDEVIYGNDFAVQYNEESTELLGGLINNGHAPSFSFDNASRILSLSSVPGLGDATFKLLSFHLHFGHDDSLGSEHKIDGVSFPSEMHFVHMNTKYNSAEEAMAQTDGLAVIGVFLQKSTTTNSELSKLTDQMVDIIDTGERIPLSVNPNLLLPTLTKIMTYPGSLTTPPCSEVVQWLMAKDVMPITSGQLETLRALRTGHGPMTDLISEYGNDRPLQSMNGRKVDANFVLT